MPWTARGGSVAARHCAACRAPASRRLYPARGPARRLTPTRAIHFRPPSSPHPAGVSLVTQELYLIVFCLRYLDLFTTFTYSYYNSVLKMAFIGTAAYIVYNMRTRWRTTLAEEKFRHEYVLGPALVLALIFTADYSIMEILWTSSIFIETVAILPQLMLLQRTGEIDTMSTYYILALGSYRGFYLLNWMYRFFSEAYYHMSAIVWLCGLIQTAIYSDFFYEYYKSWKTGTKMMLPA